MKDIGERLPLRSGAIGSIEGTAVMDLPQEEP